MAKELPYFKFYVAEWLVGDISFQPEEVQGTFTRICALYWSRECVLLEDILLNMLTEKQKDHFFALKQAKIIKERKIKTTSKQPTPFLTFLKINFLDEQWEERKRLSAKNSRNGKGGGAPKGNTNAAKEETTEKQPKNKQETTKKQPTQTTQNNQYRREESKENIYILYLEFINEKTGKKYKGADRVRKSFYARIAEGYSLNDFRLAVDNAVRDPYHVGEGLKYLTPEFFTRQDKLDKFINAVSVFPEGAQLTLMDKELAAKKKEADFIGRL